MYYKSYFLVVKYIKPKLPKSIQPNFYHNCWIIFFYAPIKSFFYSHDLFTLIIKGGKLKVILDADESYHEDVWKERIKNMSGIKLRIYTYLNNNI